MHFLAFCPWASLFYLNLFNVSLSSFVSGCSSFLLSRSIPAEVLDGVDGHCGENAVDGERAEDEEEGRAENEQLHVGGGGDSDEATDTAASPSVLLTNPLSLEASGPASSSAQGTSGLTNTGFELAALGKVTS